MLDCLLLMFAMETLSNSLQWGFGIPNWGDSLRHERIDGFWGSFAVSSDSRRLRTGEEVEPDPRRERLKREWRKMSKVKQLGRSMYLVFSFDRQTYATYICCYEWVISVRASSLKKGETRRDEVEVKEVLDLHNKRESKVGRMSLIQYRCTTTNCTFPLKEFNLELRTRRICRENATAWANGQTQARRSRSLRNVDSISLQSI